MKTFVIEMENGDVMRGELYPEIAPITVENFEKLAGEHFYDGLTFHRVIPGFMIQGGCPRGNGTGGPGYQIKGEFAANGVANDLKHTRGVLSMARQPPVKFRLIQPNTSLRRKACACAVCSSGFVRSTPS